MLKRWCLKIEIMLREGKFFGLFNIVSFPNNLCNSSQDLMQGDIFLAMMILMMSELDFVKRQPQECASLQGRRSK